MKLSLSPGTVRRRKQLAALFVFAFVLVIGIGFSVFGGMHAPAGTLAPTHAAVSQELERARIVRVVDGDTVVVERVDGSKEKVRLIGIDAPESVASDESRNTEEGRLASAYLKDLLPEQTPVFLEQDVSDRDRYDRLLRYVWLEEPDGTVSASVVAERMVNGILVGEGYARAKTYRPDTAYDEVFRELGKEAAREKRGVSYAWS